MHKNASLDINEYFVYLQQKVLEIYRYFYTNKFFFLLGTFYQDKIKLKSMFSEPRDICDINYF